MTLRRIRKNAEDYTPYIQIPKESDDITFYIVSPSDIACETSKMIRESFKQMTFLTLQLVTNCKLDKAAVNEDIEQGLLSASFCVRL